MHYFNSFVKLVVVSAMFTTQAFAATPPANIKDVNALFKTIGDSPGDTKLSAIAASTSLNADEALSIAVANHVVNAEQLVAAQDLMAEMRAEGVDLGLLTKGDLEKRFSNIQNQNLGLVLALGAIVFFCMMPYLTEKTNEHDSHVSEMRQQETRSATANADIAEANARAAKAEADAKEAQAKLRQLQQQTK